MHTWYKSDEKYLELLALYTQKEDVEICQLLECETKGGRDTEEVPDKCVKYEESFKSCKSQWKKGSLELSNEFYM